MPTDFDTTQTAAAIYADSLLDLATQAGQAESIADELSQLFDMWRTNAAFAAMMSSAAIDEDARRESIRRIFSGRVNKLVLNLLFVLNDKRRSMILPAVCRAYHKKLNQQLLRSEVFVTTAVAMDDTQRATLRQQIQRLIRREPVLVERVDPEILGGMTVQVADRVYDTSIRHRLRGIRRSLQDAIERQLRSNKLRFVTER
jgi:F-type H+-transporting ATPase subunit delta